MLFCFFLAIYAYFTLCFQCGYSKKYSVESDDIPYKYIYHVNTTIDSTEECDSCRATICKGSYCFKSDIEPRLPFIEIPINTNTSLLNDDSKHQTNKVNRYIMIPYVTYNNPDIKVNTNPECTKDSQCFTNKCENSKCAFNEDGDTRLCVDGHCGKFMKEPCTNTDECAVGVCSEICMWPEPEVVNESASGLQFVSVLGGLVLLIIIGVCIGVWTSESKANDAESCRKGNDA